MPSNPFAVAEADTELTAESDATALQRLMRTRRSIRRYQDRPVARALLEELLEAATCAPSAHNRQPWRFCVVQGTMRQTLSTAMAYAWQRDLLADGADAAWVEDHVGARAARIASAPALIVACLTMVDMDIYADARRSDAERVMGTQSVALACQNLLLAAHGAGLGACWVCAPLFVPQVVRATLALDVTWEPQALITLGWPAEEKQKQRAPLATRVVWR